MACLSAGRKSERQFLYSLGAMSRYRNCGRFCFPLFWVFDKLAEASA